MLHPELSPGVGNPSILPQHQPERKIGSYAAHEQARYNLGMQCFRLSHAGVVVELSGASLFIDPGNFSDAEELSAAMATAAPIAALVITHEHADHWTPENVATIREAAPEAPIFTTAATAQALEHSGISGATVVREGDRFDVGPFSIDFYGGRHEMLHSSIPPIDNVGVRVNDRFAWGGDALGRPPFTIDTLGVPVGSPWSNIAQVMDFVLDAKPRRAFLTHDGMLSVRGHALFAQRVEWCLAQSGGTLVKLPHVLADPGARYKLTPQE